MRNLFTHFLHGRETLWAKACGYVCVRTRSLVGWLSVHTRAHTSTCTRSGGGEEPLERLAATAVPGNFPEHQTSLQHEDPPLKKRPCRRLRVSTRRGWRRRKEPRQTPQKLLERKESLKAPEDPVPGEPMVRPRQGPQQGSGAPGSVPAAPLPAWRQDCDWAGGRQVSS